MSSTQTEVAVSNMNTFMNMLTAFANAVPPSISASPAVTIPVIWDTNDLEVFTSTGTERFQQELQSANSMLGQLSSTQGTIAAQAQNTSLLPREAFQDLSSLAGRMDTLRERIQQMENMPASMRTTAVNTNLEQLRIQLNTAVQEQNNLNEAMQNMDASAINSAYMRLSQTVSGTERYVRDNIREQSKFNQMIQEGVQQANKLGSMVKDVVTKYATVDNLKNVVNVSDEMTQTVTQLNRVNDGKQSTDELVNMVYAAAQDSRGSFGGMAQAVIGFGTEANDAFGSSEEIVAFADLIQKQVAITGGDEKEASQVMQQLAEAFGSGEISGSTLEGIFDKMPDMQQSIAGYLNVPVDQISQLAEEGKISVDMVKTAVFANSDEINAKFEEMPMTWAQVWQSMQNGALIAFAPVLEGINHLANSEVFQSIVGSVLEAMAVVGGIIGEIFGLVASVGGFIVENWAIISPIIYGVIAALALYAAYLGIVKAIELGSAAVSGVMTVAKGLYAIATGAATGATLAETTAQLGLNSALLACPIVWIILLIIALIAIFYAAVAAINKFAGTSASATGLISGAFATMGAFIINSTFIPLWNMIASFINFIGNVFNDPIAAIKMLFLDMCLTVTGYIQSLASGIESLLNKIPGVEIDITSGLDEFYSSLESARQKVQDESEWVEYVKKMDYIDYSEAANMGYQFGENIDNAVSNFSLSDFLGIEGMPDPEDYTSKYKDILGDQEAYGMEDVLANSGVSDNVGNISDNTGAIRDSVDISNEDLKYLRDVAEQEVINRFTLAEVNIDQSGMQNTINSGDDIDGFMTKLTGSVSEAVDSMAEGVHA